MRTGFWLDIYDTTEFGNTDTIWSGDHSDDDWHHIAVTWDGQQTGTSMTGYRDGVQVVQGRPEQTPHTRLERPIYVNHDEGDNQGSGADYMIDEVAFFDIAVEAEDIAAVYNDGRGLDLTDSDLSEGGAGRRRSRPKAECAIGYLGPDDTCSRECARVIEPF